MKSKSIFGRGATRLRISRGEHSTIEFGDEEVSTFQKLALETPAPKVDRVVGVLDSLTISTRTTVLKLTDGLALKGNVGANIDLESAKGLLGTEVLVEGTVVFRPSARPLRIGIDHVAAATKRDVLWTRTPRGELGQQLALPVDALSSYLGVAAMRMTNRSSRTPKSSREDLSARNRLREVPARSTTAGWERTWRRLVGCFAPALQVVVSSASGLAEVPPRFGRVPTGQGEPCRSLGASA